MNWHAPYTIFPRKMKSGRIIWYYRTWLSPSKRSTAHSSGETDKRKAISVLDKIHGIK